MCQQQNHHYHKENDCGSHVFGSHKCIQGKTGTHTHIQRTLFLLNCLTPILSHTSTQTPMARQTHIRSRVPVVTYTISLDELVHTHSATHKFIYVRTRCCCFFLFLSVCFLTDRQSVGRRIILYRTYQSVCVCVFVYAYMNASMRYFICSLARLSLSLPLVLALTHHFHLYSVCVVAHTAFNFRTACHRVFFMTTAETVFSFVATDVWHCCPLLLV